MTTAPRPQATSSRTYRFPNVERSTLPNGLQVVTAPMPRLPLVTVLALVDAGAACDPRGAEGVASLTVETLREGTKRLPGAALTEQFELLGTELTVATDWDSVILRLTVTPGRLEAAVALLGEVLCTPAFTVRDVERVQAERLAELLQREAEPRGLADDKFSEHLYVSGARYALPEAGSASSVRALDAIRVREFHQEHFVPRASTLLLVGDVTPEQAVLLAERNLGAWSGTAAVRPRVDDETVSGTRRVIVVNKSGAPQSELRIGHRGVPRPHPDYFAIVVMNAVLGGLFSSRLNLNLRERHAFTYGVQSAFDWRRGTGPFVISTAVNTESTGAATREILDEISRMRDETVAAEELSLATAYLDGVFPIRYETTQAVAEGLSTAEVYGLGEDYFDRYRDRVRAVTSDDVHRAARTFLHPHDLLILAVGDARTIRAPLEKLALGPVEVYGPTEDRTST